jgi:hypothetical protein
MLKSLDILGFEGNFGIGNGNESQMYGMEKRLSSFVADRMEK